MQGCMEQRYIRIINNLVYYEVHPTSEKKNQTRQSLPHSKPKPKFVQLTYVRGRNDQQ